MKDEHRISVGRVLQIRSTASTGDLEQENLEAATSIRTPHVSSSRAAHLDMALESIIRRKLSCDALLRDSSISTAGDLRTKLACSSEERSTADRFVAMRYAWRGYVEDRESSERWSDKRASLSYFTVLAYLKEKIVGTLTLGVDAGNGLVVDEQNQPIVDALRRTGRRVVELRRLAVRSDVGAKRVLAHLFGAAYVVGRVLHDATDVLIEVHPRHATFYRRVFGFVLVRDEWICGRISAPVVLLRLEIANLDRKLGQFGPTSKALEPVPAPGPPAATFAH
jgi:hypothetical protein